MLFFFINYYNPRAENATVTNDLQEEDKCTSILLLLMQAGLPFNSEVMKQKNEY